MQLMLTKSSLSSSHFQYGGFRVERRDVGPGALSMYVSRYELDNSKFLYATGDERRNIADVRYAGVHDGFDWDLEAMGQDGTLGAKRVALGPSGRLTVIPW